MKGLYWVMFCYCILAIAILGSISFEKWLDKQGEKVINYQTPCQAFKITEDDLPLQVVDFGKENHIAATYDGSRFFVIPNHEKAVKSPNEDVWYWPGMEITDMMKNDLQEDRKPKKKDSDLWKDWRGSKALTLAVPFTIRTNGN